MKSLLYNSNIKFLLCTRDTHRHYFWHMFRHYFWHMFVFVGICNVTNSLWCTYSKFQPKCNNLVFCLILQLSQSQNSCFCTEDTYDQTWFMCIISRYIQVSPISQQRTTSLLWFLGLVNNIHCLQSRVIQECPTAFSPPGH